MRIAVRVRNLLLAAIAVLFVVMAPTPLAAEEGILYTNNETKESYWVPMTWYGSPVSDGEEKARELLGCNGAFLDRSRTLGRCFFEVKEDVDAAKLTPRPKFYDSEIGETVDERPRNIHGSWALSLFDLATGGSCVTCDFMAYFMSGLTDFSKAVYVFFLDAFLMFMPIMISIWIGYRVAKMVSFGGEDGKAFIYSVAQKLALFAVIFLVFSQSASNSAGTSSDSPSAPSDYWAWNIIGPQYLDYGFGISTEMRTRTMAALNGTGSEDGSTPSSRGDRTLSTIDGNFNCENVKSNSGSEAMIERYPYIQKGIEISCVTERTHIIGISTGIAVMLSSWAPQGVMGFGLFGKFLLSGIMKIATGILMTGVYVMSAVWLIFLTLDIVVRVMVTAAFSPVIASLYMWQPTRGMATNAVKAYFGSIMTGVALSIVSIMALFLMTNVITVYDAMREDVQATYDSENYHIERISCTNGTGTNVYSECANGTINQFREFIIRTQESDDTRARIPMDIGTPWFYYITMAGVAIFALGKKIITMLEQIMQYQGMSAFADSATKNFKTGIKFAGAGAIASFYGSKLGIRGAVGVGSAGVGGLKAAYDHGASGRIAAGMGGAKDKLAGSLRGNPFSNPDTGAKSSILSRFEDVRSARDMAGNLADTADEQ